MDAEMSGIRQKQQNALVVPFAVVRRSIGWLGLFLPLSLVTYALLGSDGFLGSMSAYYYSSMREIFVGTLCAIGVFLWTYRGYRPAPGEVLSDRVMTRIAALGAAGIALLPTSPATDQTVAGTPSTFCDLTLTQCVLGIGPAAILHFLAAAVFFMAMALIALLLFTRGDDSQPAKRAANRIYRLCGWTIIAALLLIGLLQFSGLRTRLEGLSPVFWLEIVASIAIAVSWMVKGDGMQPLQRMMIRPAA